MTTATQALEVARGAGVEVRQKGSRWWAKCPLHGEKTASLCFFPDGKWKCFGCGAYGDAADLYAALYRVPLGEALRKVKGERQVILPRRSTANDLRRVVGEWKAEKCQEAFVLLHGAMTIITTMGDQQPDDGAFWDAVERFALANDIFNLLETATPRQLVHMMREERRT